MFSHRMTRPLWSAALVMGSVASIGCSDVAAGDPAASAGDAGRPHLAANAPAPAAANADAMPAGTRLSADRTVHYHTVKIDGVDIFYREAGPKDAPAVLLLHGFPASSFMFRNLIPQLATRYHVIAPDYPGYGQSASPDHTKFEYTFDHLTRIVDQLTQQLKLETFTMYVQDYGAPIGYRIAAAHPERITGIVVQNGNAYVEGLPEGFWGGPIKNYWHEQTPEKRAALEVLLNLEGYKGQYLTGVKDPSAVSPDAWTLDTANLDRPGNKDVQLDLLLDYRTNPPLYPQWQEYFRTHQPPMLIAWGKNDFIFPPEGAEPYKRDIKDLDFHLLDAGHFALEDSSDEIGALMLNFLDKHAGKQQAAAHAPSDARHAAAKP